MQPEQQGGWVCGVDSGGCWVGPEQLTGGVLDQLLRVTPAQSLGSVLVDGGDVIALGCTDDGAERGGGTEDGRRLLLPAQALGTTYRKERERQKEAAVSTHSSNTEHILMIFTAFIFYFPSVFFNVKYMCYIFCVQSTKKSPYAFKNTHTHTKLPFPGVRH